MYENFIVYLDFGNFWEFLSAIGTIGAVILSLWLTFLNNKVRPEFGVEINAEGTDDQLYLINMADKNLYYRIELIKAINKDKKIPIQGFSPLIDADYTVNSLVPGEKVVLLKFPKSIIEEKFEGNKSSYRIEIYITIQGKKEQCVYLVSRTGNLVISKEEKKMEVPMY